MDGNNLHQSTTSIFDEFARRVRTPCGHQCAVISHDRDPFGQRRAKCRYAINAIIILLLPSTGLQFDPSNNGCTHLTCTISTMVTRTLSSRRVLLECVSWRAFPIIPLRFEHDNRFVCILYYCCCRHIIVPLCFERTFHVMMVLRPNDKTFDLTTCSALQIIN